MTQEPQISETPAETSGVENDPNAVLSIEDLAQSFLDKVEDNQSEEPTSTDSDEGSDPDEVAAEEDPVAVLSQNQSNEEDDSEELEEESEEEESSEGDQPKGLKKALKRISTLTHRAKSAEEEVDALKEQIQDLKSKPSKPSEPTQSATKPVLENINSMKDLEALRKEALAARKWGLANLGKDYIQVGETSYDDDQIRAILSESDEYINELIPARAAFLEEKQQWSADAASTFSYLKEAQGADYELYLQVREGPNYKPWLDSIPSGDFVSGVIVEGLKAMKGKPKGDLKAGSKTPPSAPAGDAAALPTESKEDRLARKKRAALPSGRISEDQLATYLQT